MANIHVAFTCAPSLALEGMTLFWQRRKAQSYSSCSLRVTTRTAVVARAASDPRSIVVGGGPFAHFHASMGYNRHSVTMFDSIAEPTVEQAPDSIQKRARAFPNIIMSVTQSGARVLENIALPF
jgi:hypothetical protein